MFRALVLLMALVVPMLASPSSAAALPPVGEPQERKTWTWTVMDERGLALGGGGLEPDDVEDLAARGFGAVLNLRGEAPEEGPYVEAAGMDYLLIGNGFPEDDPMTVEDLEAGVAFVEESLAAGRPVYVHCRGGWHRSAAVVVAFFMKENGWRFEEAFAHVEKIRPGVEARAADGLLAYEAKLFGEKKLDVDIWSTRWAIDPDGERMPVFAYVSHHGVPVAGADVTLVQEKDGARRSGVTDADGRVDLEIDVVGGGESRYVYALAEKEGFIDGYDRNVFWLRGADGAEATQVEAPDEVRADPGALVSVPVKAMEGAYKTNARVTATVACSTVHRDYTGWDGRAWVNFTAPALPGEYTLQLRVNRFATEPVTHMVRLVVGEGGPAPSCGELAAGTPADDVVETPPVDPPATNGTDRASRAPPDDLAVVRPAPGPGLLALLAVLAFLGRRRRA